MLTEPPQTATVPPKQSDTLRKTTAAGDPAGSRPGLELRLAENWPPAEWQDVTIVVAVSGGADSIALLRGLRNLKSTGDGRIVAAHFNHRLRGAESDADEAFVVALCRALSLACEVGRAEPNALNDASGNGDGLESAARDARYDFLLSTAERVGARFIATAHTADDQAETILHRILRGTGIAGLAGIPRVRSLSPAVTLIRPLLVIGRAEVVAYLKAIEQPFREDSSNREMRFTRNQIRGELLPHLRAVYNEHIDDALRRLGDLAASAQSVIDVTVEKLAAACVTYASDGSVSIQSHELATCDPYLVCELLLLIWRHQNWPQQQMTFAKWQQLAGILLSAEESSPQPIVLPGAIRAMREAGKLILTQA